LTHTYKINDVLTINDGLRMGISNLKSTFVSQTFYKFPFTETQQDNFIWTYNVGLIYSPKPTTKISLLVSTGYRVPNIDDLTKVFDTNTGRKLVIVPNPDLKPERTANVDFTVAKSFKDYLQVEATGYYTQYRDAAIVAPFKFNGQDSILYDGVKSQVQAPQNAAKAYLWGASLSAKLKITEGVLATASYNYTKGRVQNADGTESPLDHVAPVFGRVGVQYTKNKFDSEFFVLYNGWKRITEYSTSGEDNAQYATPAGIPAWWTMNIRASYEVSKSLQMQLGVENLADIQYRAFASGINSAGRNVYATLRARF
jgi:hemoglobin/transferrin/lactoferrin receptor protein